MLKDKPKPAPQPNTKLVFQRPVGMRVGEIFNTVRVGSKDLRKGQKVDLVDGKGEVFGHATLTRVVKGQWPLVASLAADNHSTKDGDAQTAAASLREELKTYYGDKVKDDATYTIAYMRRDN